MKGLTLRIEEIEERLAKKNAIKDLDMNIEFCVCDLGPNCPTEKYRTSDIWAAEGLVVIDNKCQHRIERKDEN